MTGRRQRLTAVVLVGVALVVAGGCGRKREPTPPVAPSPARPVTVTVEWAGCAVVRVGPHCEMGQDRKLTVWVAGQEGATWTFAADGRPLKLQAAVAMQNGWQLVLDIPKAATRLSATRPTENVEAWSLALGEATLHPDIDELVLAGKRGDPLAAGRLREIAGKGQPDRRAAAEAAFGRVMLARGDANRAVPALQRAMALDRAEGRVSEEMRNGTALVWALAEQQQRFADARSVLTSLGSARNRYPEGQALYAFHEGLLAVETRDLRNALAGYRTAARIAERLGRTGLLNDATEDVALILAALGRFEEAVSKLDGLPAKTDPCAQASLMINRSETLIAAAARNENIGDARVAAAITEEQRATRACPDPRRRLLAAIHSARRAMIVGDGQATEVAVAGLSTDTGSKDALTTAQRADVLGRWALVRGDARAALKIFDDQASVAHAGGLRNEHFRAEVGAGEALLAMGFRAKAIRRLKAAQALAQRMLEDVPLAEGRGEFLSTHDEAVRHLIDALVDGGLVGEAMAVARIARASEASHAAKLDRLEGLSPEQRRQWDEALERHAAIRREIEREATEEWKLPGAAIARARIDRTMRADQARDALDSAYRLLIDRPATTPRGLPTVQRGDVEITFFPGARSWIAFSRTGARVAAHRFREELLDSTGAQTVLEHLTAELQPARRARIFTFGRSDRLDWHAVVWRGAPLISKLAVEYGLDLPDAPAPAQGGDTTTSALLVANPTGDLAAAQREGDLVTRALESWRVTRLDGPAATRDAVLGALSNVGLFHYAGHAELAGPSGAASALVLTGGARAQVGDLLALPRLPGVVVLSACQGAGTGATSGASVSMMGLAQAFLAAGARAVVAPTRDVADAEAQTFMATLYGAIRTRGLGTLPDAFRRAAIEAVGRSGQSFRLMTLAM